MGLARAGPSLRIAQIRRRFGVALAAAALAASSPARADPALVGAWTPLGSWPISATHTHLLPTGRVMFYGEFAEGATPPLEWDPATGNLVSTSYAGYNVFCSGHAFLPDGRLFVAGGHIASHVGMPHASLFDPARSAWLQLPDMNEGRWYPTVANLPSGDVLVLSGEVTTAGVDDPLPQVWSFAGSAWRDLTGAQLQLGYYYPRTFIAPDGRVFVAGPAQRTRFLDTSGTGSWATGPLTLHGGRSYGSAVMFAPGQVLIVGGDDPPTATAEIIDLNSSPPAVRPAAPMHFARRQLNATLLPDGKVLVTGGSSGAGFNNAAAPVLQPEVWDPATGAWTLLAPAADYRGYHSTSLLLPDGRILNAGGRDVHTWQVFSPPYLFAGPRPTLSSAPGTIGFGQTFAVGTPDAASVQQVNLVGLGSVTHAFDFGQRLVRLSFAPSSGGLTVTAPASGIAAPPGPYMLFLVNGSGVPSVASIVMLGGAAAPPPPPSSQTVIGLTDAWKYDDSGVDPGPTWNTAAFDDSAWKSGPGKLGYGYASLGTVLTRTSPSQWSVLFRKVIQLAGPVSSATLDVNFDDGIAVWVNGSLVYTNNVGSLAFAKGALTSVNNAAGTAQLAGSAFVQGPNLVAVMVKQIGPTSPDLLFGLQLSVVP